MKPNGDDGRMERFFRFLADRQTQENDASDVLYAAFEAFDEFRAVILYCLEIPIDTPLEITREFTIDGSRPDIHLEAADETHFLVEVKLFDRNYHYEAYSQLRVNGNPPKIILLTAHVPDQDLSGWLILFWRTVISELENSDHQINRALAKYFGRITMNEKINAIDLRRPRGILYLNRAIKRVISSYRSEEFTARVYPALKDAFSEISSGYYYELKHRAQPGKCIYPCFGLVYTDDREGIEIAIERRRQRATYDQLSVALNLAYGQLFGTEEEWSFVTMPTASFEKLYSSGNLDEQIEILTEFFANYNRTVETCLLNIP